MENINIMWEEDLSNNILHLSYKIFYEMNKFNITFIQLQEWLIKYYELINSLFECSLKKYKVKIKYKETLFKFGIYENEFCLWDNNDKTLGDYKVELNKTPTLEFIEWLLLKMENRINNKINCSECDKLIDIKDIAGIYFAGVYCKECWERKWKYIESKETYD